MLEVMNLSFSYEKKKIIDNLSFTVNNNEIVGLAGPNGSGKTTLIKNIVNILDSGTGKVDIDGINNKDSSVQKKIMYLSSEDYLPEFLTGKEYIELLCKLYNVTVNESLLNKLLSYYVMEELYTQIIEEYSHGTKKKIQLIGGFLIQPQLLIVDETLNGIDIEAREITKKLFSKYINKGKSILLCTHDFSLVEELKARALLINQGKIYYDSTEYFNAKVPLREIFYGMLTERMGDYELE